MNDDKLIVFVVALTNDGGSLEELAEHTEMSSRNVSRYIARAKEKYGMKISVEDGHYFVTDFGAFRRIWFANLND